MLTRIRLELARTKEHPDGAKNIGYEFSAPLNPDGHIDAEAWHRLKDKCRVVRFRPGQKDEIGHLLRRPGGSWAFHYDIHGNPDDDESGYRFASHPFVVGEYVSLREDDELITYRVTSLRKAE
jgi:hypothetical protein